MTTALAIATTIWGMVMGLAPILQIRLMITKRSSEGISKAWIVILIIGFALWLSYGFVRQEPPLIIANLVSLIVGLTLLGTALFYSRRPVEAEVVAD